LKEDRPKHVICPHQTDYCDQCKEFKEEAKNYLAEIETYVMETVLMRD